MEKDLLRTTKEVSSSVGGTPQALPLEIMNLLNVFARIETRRQEKLRTSRKEVA